MLVVALIMLKVTDLLEYPICFSCDEDNNARGNVANVCTKMNEGKLSLSTNGKILTLHFYYSEPSSKGGAILLDLTIIVPVFGVACKNGYGGIRI